MRVVKFLFQIATFLTFPFFATLYLYYFLTDAGYLSGEKIIIYRAIVTYMMITSVYAMVSAFILFVPLLIKRYYPKKLFIILFALSFCLWCIVTFAYPGGVYYWFLD